MPRPEASGVEPSRPESAGLSALIRKGITWARPIRYGPLPSHRSILGLALLTLAVGAHAVLILYHTVPHYQSTIVSSSSPDSGTMLLRPAADPYVAIINDYARMLRPRSVLLLVTAGDADATWDYFRTSYYLYPHTVWWGAFKSAAPRPPNWYIPLRREAASLRRVIRDHDVDYVLLQDLRPDQVRLEQSSTLIWTMEGRDLHLYDVRPRRGA